MQETFQSDKVSKENSGKFAEDDFDELPVFEEGDVEEGQGFGWDKDF